MNRRDRWPALLTLTLMLGLPAVVSAADIVHQKTLMFEGRPWVVLATGRPRVSPSATRTGFESTTST